MTDSSHIIEIRDRVDRALTTRHDELYQGVRACVAEALAMETARIVPNASLIDDLGAESLDFLDLAFRLERAFSVKLPREGILRTARQGLEADFDLKGVLSNAALERLRLLMPEVPPERFKPGLRTHEVPNLFTAETFVRLVAWRLTEPSATS